MILKKKSAPYLRIAHFNILKGGYRRWGYISKVIKNINPDICGILEAVEWQNKTKDFTKKANSLGYKFFYLAIANSKYNIAIFSKIPIEIKIIKKEIKHVAVETTIQDGLFRNLKVFFVHLSPISENNRLIEITKLLKRVTRFSSVILMGDFNSLSSTDPYARKKLLNVFQKNNITKYGINKLYFDVIAKIKSYGLIDAMEYLKKPFTNSTPTITNKDINHIAKVRIDYAFLTKKMSTHLMEAKILKNQNANQASDHYPFFIDLQK